MWLTPPKKLEFNLFIFYCKRVSTDPNIYNITEKYFFFSSLLRKSFLSLLYLSRYNVIIGSSKTCKARQFKISQELIWCPSQPTGTQLLPDLNICSWIPVNIIQDQMRCSNQVQSHSTSLWTQQKDKSWAEFTIESVNNMLSLGDRSMSIKSSIGVSIMFAYVL